MGTVKIWRSDAFPGTNILRDAGYGGTPIDVDRMADVSPRQIDYAGRPWEEDAFFSEYVVGQYWDHVQDNKTPSIPADSCSDFYEHTKHDDRIARIIQQQLDAGSAENGSR
jgi:hypothetical protein